MPVPKGSFSARKAQAQAAVDALAYTRLADQEEAVDDDYNDDEASIESGFSISAPLSARAPLHRRREEGRDLNGSGGENTNAERPFARHASFDPPLGAPLEVFDPSFWGSGDRSFWQREAESYWSAPSPSGLAAGGPSAAVGFGAAWDGSTIPHSPGSSAHPSPAAALAASAASVLAAAEAAGAERAGAYYAHGGGSSSPAYPETPYPALPPLAVGSTAPPAASPASPTGAAASPTAPIPAAGFPTTGFTSPGAALFTRPFFFVPATAAAVGPAAPPSAYLATYPNGSVEYLGPSRPGYPPGIPSGAGLPPGHPGRLAAIPRAAAALGGGHAF